MANLSDRVKDLDIAIRALERKKQAARVIPKSGPTPGETLRPRLAADETLLGQIFAYEGGDRAKQKRIRNLVNRLWRRR